MRRWLAIIGWTVALVVAEIVIVRVYAYGEVWLCYNDAKHNLNTAFLPNAQLWAYCWELHLAFPFSFFR